MHGAASGDRRHMSEASKAARSARLSRSSKTFETGDQHRHRGQGCLVRFPQRRSVSLLGPSGCGKTTVLKMMGGLIPSSGGLFELEGKAITEPFPVSAWCFRRRPDAVAQRARQRAVPDGGARQEATPRRRRAREEILKLVGLEGFEQAYPRQLSGGMQQRVALCRAIIHEPSILLMDEPFGALDELTRLEMNDLLLDIRRVTKATVLFVTHSIAEAIYLSDRVWCFPSGRRRSQELECRHSYPRSPQMRFLAEFTIWSREAGIALGVVK